MEHNIRTVSPDTLADTLPELLAQGATVPLRITGGSMTPFLAHGRDTAYLSQVDRPLKKGDMILYRRDNGMIVLHRILRMENGLYTLVGDAQSEPEPGIRPDQILAVVTAVCRKDKHLNQKSLCWLFFERIWLRLLPLRRPIMKAYAGWKRLFQ